MTVVIYTDIANISLLKTSTYRYEFLEISGSLMYETYIASEIIDFVLLR